MVRNRAEEERKMSELILELLSEEIPAFMQKSAEVAYKEIFAKHLKSNEIVFEEIEVYSGPRRITVHINGLPKLIEAKTVELKGPKINAPLQSVEGFCKSIGVDASKLKPKQVNGQEFYIYLKHVPQMDLKILLLEILPTAIKDYTWPKSMRWRNYDIAWVRPLKNILCLFDGEVLPLKYGYLEANNITYGHRFMANSEVIIRNFEDYKTKLTENYVILDRNKRQEIIWQQLQDLAQRHNVSVKEDPKLLEEVTGLVEWPVGMVGEIPEKFLKVPREALISSMRTHQKYFSTFDIQGNFASYFLFVTNLKSTGVNEVVSGNEKVLSARLSDALYFYEQDKAKGLTALGDKLKNIIFHEKLGSLQDKTLRVVQICKSLYPSDDALQNAAQTYKNDLTSEMVGEFPELQGIMGYYYALAEKQSEEVALAIRDHYKPLGPQDAVPTDIAAKLALADKLDSLICLLLAGEAPTSSGDQYGLRRLALGIIRIVLENRLAFNFENKLQEVSNIISASIKKEIDLKSLSSFIEERAKFYFKNQYDITLINAVLDLEAQGDLVVTNLKLQALHEFFEGDVGKGLCNAFKRVSNILKDKTPTGEIDNSLFVEKQEYELFAVAQIIAKVLNDNLKEQDFANALSTLSTLHDPLSNFFDNVMVNAQDPKLASNRLLLLEKIYELFGKVAKFDML